MQKNAFAASGEYLTASERKLTVLCPKPRRIGPFSSTDVARPVRLQSSPQPDPYSSKPGLDFLEFFLPKGAESPFMSAPFFCGSPPSRSDNPVVHDARFGEDRPVVPLASPVLGSTTVAAIGGSPMSPRSSGACARKLGVKPAAVRIEGFDYLDRSRRRGCSITAVA